MPYLLALALTLAIEVPLYWVVVRQLGRAADSAVAQPRDAVGTAVAVNLVSHPVAMLVALPLLRGQLTPAAALATVEVAVLLFEAGVVARRYDHLTGAVASGTANVASLAIGLVLVG